MRRISDEEKRQASVERSVAGSYNPQGLRQMTMKTYSTYAMRLPLAVTNSLFQAEMLLKAGCVTQTLQAHHRLLNDESLPPEGYLIALCCHAAMRWVQTLFTEAEAHTLAVTAVFPVLRDLNLHLLARAGVQQALIGALELPDTATESHYFTRLGEALFALEKWVGAETALLQGLARQPESSLLHSDLAVLLWQQGRRPQAIAHLETALRLDPSNQDARTNAQRPGIGPCILVGGIQP